MYFLSVYSYLRIAFEIKQSIQMKQSPSEAIRAQRMTQARNKRRGFRFERRDARESQQNEAGNDEPGRKQGRKASQIRHSRHNSKEQTEHWKRGYVREVRECRQGGGALHRKQLD
jgi:hypothetical protein